MIKVGTIVELKVHCLGNIAGTKGVVFYDYEDGYQAIFKNGSYDGFSRVHTMPSGEIEVDYFLKETGFCSELASYVFKNVTQVSIDFRKGIFDCIKKG